MNAAKDSNITADKTTTTYNIKVPSGATEEQMDKIVRNLREKMGPENCGGGGAPAPGGAPPAGDGGAKAAAAEVAASQERAKADADIAEQKRQAAEEVKRAAK